MRRAGGGGVAAGMIAALLLGLAPFVLDPASLGTLGRIVYFALLAASLDLLVGITGLPSLAHAGFFAVGAYTAGLVAKDVSALAVVVLPAAVVVAGLASARHRVALGPQPGHLLPDADARHRRDHLPARGERPGRHGWLERALRHPAARGRSRQRRAFPARTEVLVRPRRVLDRLRHPVGGQSLTVRSRAARHPRQRGANARARVLAAAVQVRRVLPRGRDRRAGRRAARGASAGRHARRRRVRHRGGRARVGDHRRCGDAVGPVPGCGGRGARPRPDRTVARRARPVAAGPGVHRGGLPAPGRHRRRGSSPARGGGRDGRCWSCDRSRASSAGCVPSTASTCAWRPARATG